MEPSINQYSNVKHTSDTVCKKEDFITGSNTLKNQKEISTCSDLKPHDKNDAILQNLSVLQSSITQYCIDATDEFTTPIKKRINPSIKD